MNAAVVLSVGRLATHEIGWAGATVSRGNNMPLVAGDNRLTRPAISGTCASSSRSNWLPMQAKRASSGRSAETVFGGHERHLRQTLIALRAGESLSEHENPGEATVQVLFGRVLLRAGSAEWNGSPGDLLTVPDGRHALDAV